MAAPTIKPTQEPTAAPTEEPAQEPTAEAAEAPTRIPENSIIVKIEKQPEESTASLENSGKKEVTIDLNESGIVYSETLKKMKEQEIEATFKVGDNIRWTINGNSIDSDSLADVNLKVKTDGGEIPDKKIQELVTDGSHYLELSLSQEGEFGFKAVLTVKMEEGNPGQYANLFYYNKDEIWEFMGASIIDNNRDASFEFEHASEYLIVINDKIMDNALSENVNVVTGEIVQQPEDEAEIIESEVSKEETGKKVLILILILLGSIFIVLGTVLVVNRKSS